MIAAVCVGAVFVSLAISYALFPDSGVPGDAGYAGARFLFVSVATIVVGIIAKQARRRYIERPEEPVYSEYETPRERKARLARSQNLASLGSNREIALQVAGIGGMAGIMARLWLQSYEHDPSVPAYGARPYWTQADPGSFPQLLSMMGMRGVNERLQYAREHPRVIRSYSLWPET